MKALTWLSLITNVGLLALLLGLQSHQSKSLDRVTVRFETTSLPRFSSEQRAIYLKTRPQIDQHLDDPNDYYVGRIASDKNSIAVHVDSISDLLEFGYTVSLDGSTSQHRESTHCHFGVPGTAFGPTTFYFDSDYQLLNFKPGQ